MIAAWVAAGRTRRQERAYVNALPDLLEAAARELRGGASLRAAIVAAVGVVPAAATPPLELLAGPLASGAPLVAAVERWARSRIDSSTRLAAAALALAASAGGPAARSLDAVAATLRDRIALAGEISALTAQARLSAIVVGGAPVAFAILTTALDPRALTFLVTTPAGLVCLSAGCGLDLVGLWWMRRIAVGATW